MARISTTFENSICLDTEEGYAECPAVFDIEGQEPDEFGAELMSATFGNLTLTRDQVAAITGEDHIRTQEGIVAEAYARAYQMGEAA